MQAGAAAGVFHRQIQASFIAGNGLVLGAVEHIGPVHIALFGSKVDEGQEDANAEQALDQIADDVGHVIPQKARQKGGQKDKQHDGDGNAEHQSSTHHDLFQRLLAELTLQPAVEPGLVFSLFLFHKIGRIHQGTHTELHGIPEADHAPDDRQAGPGAVTHGSGGLHFYHHFLAGFAADDGSLLGAAHQDAFDEGLAGDGGFLTGFVGHSVLFLSYSAVANRGRVMRTLVPSPKTLSMSSVPPCICTMSLHTERPMPAPRPLALPL